jgi:hypothetical protein
MKVETVSNPALSPLPPLSDARLERLRARVPLVALSARSGVPLTTLSQAERGLRQLSEPQEKAIREALLVLAVR